MAGALDRRTHLRLARTLPTPRQGLREPVQDGPGIPASGHDPPHAAQNRKVQKIIVNLPDGLSLDSTTFRTGSKHQRDAFEFFHFHASPPHLMEVHSKI